MKTGGASGYVMADAGRAVAHPGVGDVNLSGGLHRHVKNLRFGVVDQVADAIGPCAGAAICAGAVGPYGDRYGPIFVNITVGN